MTSTTPSFMEKCLHGEADISQVDDYVDAWHESSQESCSLAEFLGLTDAEYATWVEKPSTLKSILLKRKVPEFDRQWLANFCRTHRIRKLSLFGSALTHRFHDDSDIDLLVEFEPEARVSLFDVGGMMHELTEKLGRPVDLRTPNDLSRYFRRQVVTEAEAIYAA